MKETFNRILPGILYCMTIAVPAWILGRNYPVIGGPVFGILFGILLASFAPKSLRTKFLGREIEAGVKFTSKKILQYSIILLGFEMNLFHIIRVGGQSLIVMLFTLSTAFLIAYCVGKILHIKPSVATLIGVGTSICGGSAIAATAPVIRAEDEDVAHSISTIFLFNIVAVFLFPAMGRLLGMTDTGFGIWAGTAINDTSSVVAAGSAWSAAAGNDTALTLATIVKLTRTLMIVPITLVLAVYTAKKTESTDSRFNFLKVFPWFVIGFVLAALINTFLPLPEHLPSQLSKTGKFLIVMAMSAIGLNTQLKKLISNGWKPIFLGLCCWIGIAAVSIGVQIAMGLR